MSQTTYPGDDGNEDIFEPKIEALVDPVDGDVKRWRSMGYTTGGCLCLAPAGKRGIDLSWRSRDEDPDELSAELYYLMQACRSLLDIGTGHDARREYDALPIDAWEHEAGITSYHLCALARARYLISRRAEGGEELWVLEDPPKNLK